VKVYLADDADNAATSATQVKKLVEGDKVQAIVDASFSEDSWKNYTNSKDVAISGGNQDNPQFSAEPLFFPSGGTFPAMYYGMTNELKKMGKTKVSVMVCAELPVCAGVSKIFAAVGENVVGGVKVVSTGKIAATSPNYLAQCLQAKGSGSDAAMLSHSSDVTVRVASNCTQQGYKPQYINYSSTMSSNWLKSPDFNGVITAQPNAPLSDDTLPGMKAFHSALQQYAPDYLKQNTYGVITLNQWSGFELFKAAAEAGKITADSTTKDVVDAMYKLKDETLGGISPPLNFKVGQPTLIPCYFVQGIKDGQYTAPRGVSPICVPTAKIPALVNAIKSAAG
jgi:branched-chain amino acid transport system substrate-binding protein